MVERYSGELALEMRRLELDVSRRCSFESALILCSRWWICRSSCCSVGSGGIVGNGRGSESAGY